MAFNNGYTAVTGATYTAAQYNTYTRDNFAALWPYTTAGDIVYALSATTLARLPKGAEGASLCMSGGVPVWIDEVPGLFEARGDMVYATGANEAGKLAIGTAGHVLTVVGGAPAWAVNESFKVGDLHFSTVATNPAITLGYGTWESFGAGRVLMGDGGGYSAGETGGAATHTLSAAEMPVHTHSYDAAKWYEDINGPTSGSAFGTCDTTQTYTTGNAGSGSAHNNLQPYIVVYIWKRTA